jgi:putative two-component system response regulator
MAVRPEKVVLMNMANTSTGKTVLVVEDSPTQGLHLQAILRQHGLRVVCAWNGEVGITMAHQIQPDLVVLDMQMPDITGLEVCQRLKATADTAAVPIIIFTHNNNPDVVSASFESGAVDYIPKDVFADAVLVETLRQMGLIQL